MTTVKDNKEIIKKLKERFESLLGKKISDEDLIEKCLNFSNIHIDELLGENNKSLKLTPELKEKILSNAQDCDLYHLDKSDDELLYGI